MRHFRQCAFMTALVSLVLAQSNAIAASAAGAETLSVPIPEPKLLAARTAGGVASFAGEPVSGDPETPGLPRPTYCVLLPPDADLRSVRASVAGAQFEVLPGLWDVAPIPMPVHGQGTPAVRPRRDPRIYGVDRFFPDSWSGAVTAGELRGWRLADVRIHRYQYNPVTRVLRRLARGQLIITFNRQGQKAVARGAGPLSRAVRESLRQRALNFDTAAEEYGEPETAAPAVPRYVVLTTETIRSISAQLPNFVASKRARGFDVDVVTASAWGGGTGNVAADRIRHWLKVSHQSRPISYVLLVGNPDPVYGDVPMKMCVPRSTSDSDREAPTDFYYADLSGNWDLDGDGTFGEWDGDYGPGGADRYWEVLVGRIPEYGNAEELDSILWKITAYENEPPSTNWRRRALLPMEPSDSATPGWQLGEAIKSLVLVPKGDWAYHRVYEEDYGLVPPPETVSCTMDNTTAAWLAAPTGLTLWWSHGWSQGAADVMDLPHAQQLDNNVPSFTFQCSCNNAWPEDYDNLAYRLLANGAVSTVGATRVSWYWIGQTDFPGTPTNSGMTYEYARRLVAEEQTAAEALQGLKVAVDPGGDFFWMNYIGFNLYGDPSIGLYTFQQTVPTVAITRPRDQQSYPAGANVTIAAAVADERAVVRVDFYQGTTLIGTDNTSPYGVTWLGVPSGSYTLQAKAYGAAGYVGSSAVVHINVSGNATLLVVGNTALSPGDAALKSRLENQGFAVAVKASSDLKSSDASGKVLVVLSDTLSPSSVGGKFRTVATPVLCLEPQLLDDLGMTGAASGVDYGSVGGQTKITIVDPSHHMAGGQTGTVTVTSSAQTFAWGKPSAQAKTVATLAGNPGRSAVFGYDAGARMPGLVAPGRRVGWFAGNGAAAALNSAGKELLDSAARWASGRVGL